ncbi:MAG: serine hydrolase domain-containing protein [Bacteroidia bacterium]|nr:serine hydrolase domain-containing protein [Bacteroidia bacterium]
MKTYSLFICLALLMACNMSSPPQSSSSAEEGLFRHEQDELIIHAITLMPENTQFAMALIKAGEVEFLGVNRIDTSSFYTKNSSSVFEIGSISKVFTSTLLAGLSIEGKIKLEDKVETQLPFSFKQGSEITFEQLATHTAGLPRIPPSLETVSLDNPYLGFDETRLKRYLSQELLLENEPGKVCEYSNLSAAVLGYSLEKVSGSSYEELLQQRIFTKYEMPHSTTLRENIKDRLVIGINDEGEEVPNWDMETFMGAGGILSTVEDLSKFALAQFDSSNQELNLTRQEFFPVTENFSMGLGWSLISAESGAIWNWHNGGTGGYTSSMILETESQNGVIVLSNISALGELTSEVSGLAHALMLSLE